MALIHWWPLTGDTSDHVDSSHTQTITALPTSLKGDGVSKRAGKVSLNTFDFNGSNTLIDTGVQQSSLGNNFTISAWLFADTNSSYRDALGRHNNGGTGGFCFGQFDGASNSAIDFSIVGKNASGNPVYSGVGTTLPLNTWTHFTMVVKDGKTIQIYKNGELVGSSSNLVSLNINWNPIGTIWIGKSCPSDRYWDGAIQDIRIYDEPLSPKEIKKLAQGVIIHYNPDNILGYNLLNHHDWYTANSPYTTISASTDNGPSLNVGCDIVNGKTYTLSANMDGTVTDRHGHNESVDKRSCSIWLYFKHQTWAEGAYGYWDEPDCYTRTFPTFRRISKTRYAWTFNAPTDTNIKSCSIRVNTYSDGTHPITVHFWNFKLEEGDVATPFSLNRDGQTLDSSGFGYDGTIVGEAIEKSTDHKWKKNIVADGNWEHHIQSNINPSFLTSGVTFNVWHKNVTKKDFLLANGHWYNGYIMAMSNMGKWSSNVDGAQTYYIDGQLSTDADGHPKDGQWHMYTVTCAGISKWTELYWNRYADVEGNAWAYNGPLGDIRLYATALSAADVKNLYNETRVTHPMQFLISNSSTLSSLTSSNPVLADGELVVVRSTVDGKTYFNIRKGNGVNNFNSLPWKRISEATLKAWRNSFSSDSAALDADTGSYTVLK